MAEDIQDSNSAEQFPIAGENLRKGTTDINAFLPFGGKDMPIPDVDSEGSSKFLPNMTSVRSNQFPIQDNVSGFSPFKPGNVNKTNTQSFSTPQDVIKAIKLNLNTLQDSNVYAKVGTYDASSSAAHKARYKGYGQATYDRIGFNPDLNNEALFNSKTTAFDDLSRMAVHSALPLFGLGFLTGPKSYAKAFSGDFGQDVDEAMDYEERSAIGYSTKGGVLGFTNNVLNSFAYTAGILVEGAIEGALIGGAIGSVEPGGGTVIGGAAGGLAGLLSKIGKIPQSLSKMYASGSTLLTRMAKLQNISEARTMFNSASKTVGNFLNPFEHSMDALGKYAFNNADNLSNMARASKTFGGFYFDIRNANMALSEARLEGGFVDNSVYKELYDTYYAEHNEAPSAEKQYEFKKVAEAAGWQATWTNSILINYSNKLVFPNIMRGGKMRTLAGFDDVIRDLGPVKVLHNVKDGFKVAEVSFKNSLKALTKPGTYGKLGLNYFKANLAEGLQESAQDVIADYTQKYYIDTYNNPALKTWAYSNSITSNAIKKQFSAQGFETFASGFVMGSLSKSLDYAHKYLSIGFNKMVTNKTVQDEYIKDRTKVATELVDELNETYKDPAKFFESKLFNYGTQAGLARAHDDEDITTKEDVDIKDAALKSSLITMFETGTSKYFLDQLKSYKGLNPEEIEDAMKLEKGEGEKALQRIDGIINKFKSIKSSYEYAKNKMGSPINPNNFAKDTDEHKRATIYKKAWDAAKFNMVFLSEAFKTNLDRNNKLNGNLTKIAEFKKLEGNDIQPLLDIERLDDEIKMLTEEITLLESSTESKSIKQREKKQQKLNDLVNYGEKLSQYYNHHINYNALNTEIEKMMLEKGLSKDEATTQAQAKLEEELGAQGKDVINELKQSFVQYLTNTAGGETDFMEMMNAVQKSGAVKSIEDAFEQLTDYHKLKDENRVVTKYVNMLNDPAGFAQHVDKNFEWMSNLYENRKDYAKKIINDSLEAKERDDLLKSLSDEGIFVDLDEFADWVEDPNKLPSHFISDADNRIIPQGSYLYNEYAQRFIDTANMQAVKAAGEASTVDEKLKDELAEIESNKQKELDNARKGLNRDLKKAYNKTEQELRQEEAKAKEEEANPDNSSEENLKSLTDLKLRLQEDIGGDIDNLISLATSLNILTIDEYIAKNQQVENDSELISKIIIPRAQVLLNENPGLSAEQQNLLIKSVIAQYVILPLVDEQIAAIEAKPKTKVIPFIVVEDTEAWANFQSVVEEINTRYAQLVNDTKAKYIKKGVKTEEQVEKIFTTSTPWDELDEELKAILQPEFDKYVEKIGGINEDQLETARTGWLETQNNIISNYNKTKEVVPTKIKSEVPKLSFVPETLSDGRTIEDLKVTELVVLRKTLQTYLDTNKKPDPNNTEKLIKLTQAEKNNIQSDINSLLDYIEFKRTSFQKDSKFEEAFNVFKKNVFDRQQEVEEIKDPNNDEDVIGRIIDGQMPQRVTKHTEQIELDLVPQKTKFTYGPLAPIYNEDGELTSPGDVQSLFLSILENENIKQEDKLKSFITQFKSKNYAKSGQFASDRKIKDLTEALSRDFSLTNVVDTVSKLAFDESTKAGKLVDSLTRDFFTLDVTESGFKSIVKPDGMSQKAFDNLFGPNGVITEFRDRMIDGEFYVISNNVNVFDMTLLENGLAGEMDLLAINSNGDFSIIDIKTASEDKWKGFNKEFLYKVKEGDTLESIAKENKTTIDKLTDLNDFEKHPVTPGKMIYTDRPNTSKKLYYSIQQSMYRNLFYNMTGKMPVRLGLLPISVDITIDGFISNAGRAPIVAKTEATVKLDYITEVEEYGVTPQAPEIIEEVTPVNEDIEAKKAERIKRYSNRPANRMQKYNPDGENTDLTQDQIDEIEQYIEAAKKAGWNADRTFKQLNKLGYVYAFGNTPEAFKNYLEDRLSGETNIKVTSEININAQIDAELAALEGGVKSTEGETGLQVTMTDSSSLKDNIGQTVIFEGAIGNLVKYDDGVFGVEMVSENVTNINGNIFSVRIDLYKDLKPVTDPDALMESVGVSRVSLIDEINQVSTIKNKTIDAKFTSAEESTAIINGITYTVNKDSNNNISSLTYKINDAKINDINIEVGNISKELTDINKKLATDKDFMEADEYNILKSNSIKLQDTITKLNVQRKDLINTNIERTIIGGNSNDFIFALNRLPKQFKKKARGKKAKDEQSDLKNVDNLSTSSSLSAKITEIMSENYPKELDKLIGEGVEAINETELTKINAWLTSTVKQLQNLGFVTENKGDLTVDLTNQINVLNELLNNIKLIKLNKNGKISKQQGPAAKVFGQPGVQTGTGVSKVQEPGGEQTTGVSGSKTGAGAKPSEAKIKAEIKGLQTELNFDSLIAVGKKGKKTKDLTDSFMNKLDNTTIDTIEVIMADIYTEHIKDPLSVDLTSLTNKFNEKKSQLNNDIIPNNLELGNHIISKLPKFAGEIFEVISINKAKGQVTIQDTSSMDMYIHKEDYLMENFSKITPETLAKPVITLTEEDIDSSKETIDNLEDVLGNTDLLNKAADEAKTQDKTSLRDKLKNNSNKC